MIDCRAYVGFFCSHSWCLLCCLLVWNKGLFVFDVCVQFVLDHTVGCGKVAHNFFGWCFTLMCIRALLSIKKEVPICCCMQFTWTSAHNDYYYFVGYVKEIRKLKNLKLFVIIGDALVLCLKPCTTTNYLVLMMCLSTCFSFLLTMGLLYSYNTQIYQ